jgi:hypothetical protein
MAASPSFTDWYAIPEATADLAILCRCVMMRSVHAELEDALAPVVDDLTNTCGVQPSVEPWGPQDDGAEGDQRWVMLREPDGSGAGAGIRLGQPIADQIVELADHAQEWAVEALNAVGLPAVWPECPLHPDSHPLAPLARQDVAIWLCPRNDVEIAPIGRLPGRG